MPSTDEIGFAEDLGALNQFLDHPFTIKNVNKDFKSWHLGRQRYYFWSILVDSADWINLFQGATKHLQPFMLSSYHRQPHITILPAGFDGVHNLEQTLLVEICQHYNCFELSLGILSSFTSSAYFEVHEPSGKLRNLRADLARVMCDSSCMTDELEYVPHMTVGLYDGVYPTPLVADLIQQFAGNLVSAIKVRKIALASYQTSSVGGPIEVIMEIELESGRTNWVNNNPHK